jgi:hypothetical protein
MLFTNFCATTNGESEPVALEVGLVGVEDHIDAGIVGVCVHCVRPMLAFE